MANVSFKQALKKVSSYLNKPLTSNKPTQWNTPFADKLTQAQQFVERVPERPVKFRQIAQEQSAPIRFLANLPQTIVSETLNIPNRTIYNAREIGEGIREKNRNKILRGSAGAGEALLDVATLGVGGNVIKEGIQEAGSRSFKETLKRLRAEPVRAVLEGVRDSKGLRLGAGQGSLVGVQSAIDRNPNATMEDILGSATTSGVVGAGVGLVAEPALRYGSEAVGKAAKMYRNSPLADQKGSIDSDLLTGGMKRILSGKSKASSEKAVQKEVGRAVGPQVAESYLKNTDPVNVKALQDSFKTLSRTTMYKSFDDDKALRYLSSYIDQIGGERVLKIQKRVFGNKVMTPDLVKQFSSELKKEATGVTGKPYKQLEQEADDSLLGVVDDVVGGEKNFTDIPKQTMDKILKPTVRNEADNIYGATKEIIDKLPPRANVTDQQTAQTVFEGGLGALKQAYQEIEDRATKFVSKEDFAEMNHGSRPVDPRVRDLYDIHQSLNDDLYKLAENPNIGKITGAYFPEMKGDGNITRVMDELFPGMWIDRASKLGGNLHNKRTGKNVDFNKDYAKVMGNFVEQVLYEKYRGVFKGSTPVIEEIVEHVKKAGDDTIDYVTKLAPEPKKMKGEVAFKSDLNLPGGSARTYENIFEHIGAEFKDFFTAFRSLRDSGDIHRKQRKAIVELMSKPNGERKVMDYIAEVVLGHKGDDKARFFAQHAQSMQREGVMRFTEKVLGSDRHYRMQQFVEEASKYTYKSGTTKDAVNSFIDNVLKQESLEPAMLDGIANLLLKTFYRAHLGLNAKVGILQALEVNRIPASYGFKNFMEGLKGSVLDAKRLLNEYGFEDVKPHYLVEDFNTKVKPSMRKEAADTLDNVLMKHISIMEKWKNIVYAGAAEAQGKEMNLSGKALYDHVRDSVYKNAHIADEFNTPAFMMNKEKIGGGENGIITKGVLARMAGQYGQFALKNLVGKVDAFQAGEIKKLTGLLMADLLNIAIVMQAFGAGRNVVETTFGQFFPSGLGPTFTIPFDLLEAYQKNEEAKEQGYSTDYTGQQLQKLLIGSFVPAGAQINKTRGQIDTMLQGFKPTSGGLVAYPESGSAMENLYGMLFGASATPSGKQYGEDGTPYLRENQTNEYKRRYEDDPQGARDYYKQTIENRKQKGNTVDRILKKGAGGTSIKTADDGQLILPTPSGNTYTIEELLSQKAEKDKKNSTITQIMGRKDQYEGLPAGEELTQEAFRDMGITPEDYRMWKLKKVNNDLSGKEKAGAFMEMVKSGETTFTELFKEDILSKAEMDDLERYGYIDDAEALYDKLKMTDSFYIKKEMKKLKKDTMEKLLKNQAKVQKQLVNESAKRQISFLRASAKATTRKPRRRATVNLPSLRSRRSTTVTQRYAPERQRRITG